MKVQKKALFIQKTLDTLFPHPKIPLTHETPYTLLIAVLLSAQCTDKRVNQITPYLFAKAKTPQEMIKLSIEQIAEMIHSCGLSHTKAKAIWHLSKQLLEKYQGHVPDTLEDLESLAGVGHKTASVVLCQAFHKPAFPVDTHIHRCANRWGLCKSNSVIQTEKALKKLFPQESWITLHLQIIYFARAYCPARGHKIEHCPICQALGREN